MTKPILPAILACQSTALSDAEKRFFAKTNPLGINLFGRNIENKAQIKNLVKEIKETIGRDDVLIAIDQEGGRVRRLREPEFMSYAAAIDLGSLPPAQAAEAATLHASLIAADLNELGINVNYAPVLDILYPQTSEALKSRCFSVDNVLVSALGRCEVNAYINNGILPCIKHMPGHGRTDVDPHLGLPKLNQSLEELRQDFFPFKELNDCPLGMTAHIVISAVDETAPLTQSKKGIDTIIRGEIGFDGLLISDAIDMKALRGTAGQKAHSAIDAGCDIICYALGNMAEMEEIAAVLPPMSDKSLERFAKAVKVFHNIRQRQSYPKMAAAYQELTGNIRPYQETYDATEVLNHLMKNNTNTQRR